jgi:putative AlgH/UPF0301 family transcriptional regulator
MDESPSDHDDGPQMIKSNWHEFRAKLTKTEGHAPIRKGQRAARESLRRLAIDHPEWAAEAEVNGLWCIPTVIEKGGLLIARKGVTSVDKRFEHSVLLIIEHDKKNGSIALKLDKPTPLTFGKGGPTGMPLSLTNAPEYVQATFKDNRLYCGGYTSQHVIFLIHGSKLVGGSVEISPGIFMGGELAAASEVVAGRMRAADFKFFAGAVVWERGKLEREVRGNCWYSASASRALVLRQTTQLSTPLWKELLWLMGPEYAQEVGLDDQGEDEGESDSDEEEGS